MTSQVVVVVEDSDVLRQSLERIVSQSFTPRACSTYDAAVATLADMTERPLALIVDVNLGPGAKGDGLDIAQLAHDRFGHIPTLVLTSASDLAEVTLRSFQLRAEFLVKPQDTGTLRGFLERARVRDRWGVADVIEVDRAVQEFATLYQLTPRQTEMVFLIMSAAERSEPVAVNENTRKAAVKRILRKCGHDTFEQVRQEIKHLALNPRRAT